MTGTGARRTSVRNALVTAIGATCPPIGSVKTSPQRFCQVGASSRSRCCLQAWRCIASMTEGPTVSRRRVALLVASNRGTPSTTVSARWMVICAPSRSTSLHRRPTSSPRRAPVPSARCHRARHGWSSTKARNAAACSPVHSVGPSITSSTSRWRFGGRASSAALAPSSPSMTASCSARWSRVWM